MCCVMGYTGHDLSPGKKTAIRAVQGMSLTAGVMRSCAALFTLWKT